MRRGKTPQKLTGSTLEDWASAPSSTTRIQHFQPTQAHGHSIEDSDHLEWIMSTYYDFNSIDLKVIRVVDRKKKTKKKQKKVWRKDMTTRGCWRLLRVR